eukprot:363075-Chlamydomonas_euryale.AAC.5
MYFSSRPALKRQGCRGSVSASGVHLPTHGLSKRAAMHMLTHASLNTLIRESWARQFKSGCKAIVWEFIAVAETCRGSQAKPQTASLASPRAPRPPGGPRLQA